MRSIINMMSTDLYVISFAFEQSIILADFKQCNRTNQHFCHRPRGAGIICRKLKATGIRYQCQVVGSITSIGIQIKKNQSLSGTHARVAMEVMVAVESGTLLESNCTGTGTAVKV